MTRANGGIRDQFGRQPRFSVPGHGMPVTWAPPNADQAPEAIRADWGGIYAEIDVDGHGRWVALRRDGRAALIGDGPDALVAAIRADSARGPR